jgi:hypothetical protein
MKSQLEFEIRISCGETGTDKKISNIYDNQIKFNFLHHKNSYFMWKKTGPEKIAY